MTGTTRLAMRRAAHRLLEDEVGAVLVARLCPRCGSSEHGRPLVRVRSGPAPHVSLSYAAGLVAVAWSRNGPVGIDVEVDGPDVDGLERREWTRREAAFKAAVEAGSDPPTRELGLPAGYVGAVVGTGVTWRLAGPAAGSR